jgi:alkylhydroperoxidase/carboxymuconolactone decarboxylase family protein YurZ
MPDHPLKTLHALDPELMKHLDGCQDLFYGDGALPRKFKLLIAMAFDAAHGADRGVHARAALREGASKAEIAEAIRVAYHLTGVGTLYTAALGLKEIVAESGPIL